MSKKTLVTVFFRLFFLALLFLAYTSSAQENSESNSSRFRLPIVSVAQGVMNFSGDVGYNKFNQPLLARSGFQVEIEYPTASRFAFGLSFLSGRVYGEEKTIYRAINFKSTILAGGLVFRYDFISRNKPDQILIPFLTAGVEYLTFTPKADLLDKNGNQYNYWSDGTIRNMSQDAPASDQAVKIYRDYTYETDLRDANLDGFGKFSNSTWGVPVGAGVRLKVSERLSMHFSSVVHLTGSDFIDGVTSDGKGIRKGNEKNDKVIFTSVSIRFALSHKTDDSYKNVDFNALVNEDADGDGIPDLVDDSSGTPRNNAVSINGKPYDADNDGIPDYRDQEPNSATDAVVNEQGVTITEEMIEEKFRKDSLAALPAVIEYLKSYDKLTQRNPDVEKRWIEKNSANNSKKGANRIPPIYSAIDTDNNQIITPKEISRAIDDYLAKKSTYTISEFFDLIDFFFSQN